MPALYEAVWTANVLLSWGLLVEEVDYFPLRERGLFEMMFQVVTSPLCTTENLTHFLAVVLSLVDLKCQSASMN